MAQPSGKPVDTVRRPCTAASASRRSAAKNLQPLATLPRKNGITRRGLLTLLASTAAIPEASESRKALLQEYLNKSKENKEKNDKERLDDYYKRNYKDYFGLIEGPARQKTEEELTESEKRILEWLDKNK
ncbi:photosystem I reaction center subunit N, chloroplastic [Oryza brachyantha]|uniref:Photosystem I reaction center subunit N n=1 Tax=Oryza brachyantha TaxID=4533 RepID=J3LSI4_ORYBR|nr:photosystem I reaction center subunit N, chloroplastic [Oryza brachyantha]